MKNMKRLYGSGGDLPYPMRKGDTPSGPFDTLFPKVPFRRNLSGREEIYGNSYATTPTLSIPTGKISSITAGVGPITPGQFKTSPFAGILADASGIAGKAQPFVSNIVNAFRHPPKPTPGVADPMVTLTRVNMDNERSAVSRNIEASNRNTERNIDSNTAEAIKAFNRGTKFSQLSSINERETNANVGIANQEAGMNSAIVRGNNAKKDDYNQSMVERNIADQREQSANWANAGDKITLMRNETEKGRVELEKARVLAGLFKRSGVLERQQKFWDEDGLDPLKTKQAFGGFIGRARKIN